MKVLITGGAGFIGSHTAEKFLEENCEVQILDNLSTGCKDYLPKNLRLINMDIRSTELRALFMKERYDIVVNLAAQVSAPASIKDPFFDADINTMGLLNVLEACTQSGVQRIVSASSAAVYGDNDNMPLTESDQTNPMSFYGLTKLTMEKYLQLYCSLFALSFNALRYANVYGERQGNGGEGGVISVFLNNVKNNQDLTIHGDGEQTRDFVYVKDIANANYLAATTESKHANAVYNISTNSRISVNGIVAIIQKNCFRDINVKFVESRKGDIMHSALNNAKAKECLGWHAKYDIQSGMLRTVKYFLDR